MMKEFILKDPTDDIEINDSIADELYSLWCGSGKNRKERYYRADNQYFQNIYIPFVPDDLLRSRTVPLPDFSLRHHGLYFMRENDDSDTSFTVNTLFPEESNGDFEIYIRCEWYAFHYRLRDEMFPGNEMLPASFWESWFLPFTETRRGRVFSLWWYENPNTRKELEIMRSMLLADWYGIQLALLHPSVKEVFKNPKITKVYERTGKGKDRKRRTRYVRAHTIENGDIESRNSISNNCIHRKTLAWWVIGHQRHYKNGKTCFINGYWKGPLRDAKRNLDKGRDRIIV